MFCESDTGGRRIYVPRRPGDLCSLYINGKRVIKEQGYKGWTFKQLLVSKGPAFFKWVYEKDDILNGSGQDTMKLANIAFVPDGISTRIPAVNIADMTE